MATAPIELSAEDAPRIQGVPVGTAFGEYVAGQQVAAGGMSELYLGRNPQGETVAIKRLLPHLSWNADVVRMFADEVRIAGALDHPNIVRVLDYGMGAAGHYLVMEHLHGADLREVLAKAQRPLPIAMAIDVVLEVARALHYAHNVSLDGEPLPVIHRDVSPANIFVGHDGSVKLLDFGIAKVAEHTRYTRTGTLKGKLGYMSPEQCQGRPADPRSDLFALGVVLYEATLGRRAFAADNEFAILNAVIAGEYPPPATVDPDYPPALAEVIERALQVMPEARFAHALAFVDALEAIQNQLELARGPSARGAVMNELYGAPPVPAVAGDSRGSPSRSVWRWGGALAVVLLGAASTFALRARAPESPAATTNTDVPPVVTPAPASPGPDDEGSPNPPEGPARLADEASGTTTGSAEPPTAEEPAVGPSRRPKNTRRPAKRRKRSRSTATPANPLLPPSLRERD